MIHPSKLPLSEYGAYFGVDISKNMIQHFDSKFPEANKQVMDGVHTSFPDGYFDIIWCWSVFTHVDAEDTQNILEEMQRIIKLCGKIYLSFIPDEDIKTYGGEAKVYITYNPNYFKELIRKAGFENIKEVDEMIGEAYNRKQILLEVSI